MFKNWFYLFFIFSLSCFVTSTALSKVIHYELTVEKKEINVSGKKNVDFALLVNGTLPAPTLNFTEGDEAEIVVKNRIPNEEVSIHWHGILLDPEMDGVPYVTTPPIHSGTDYTFRFRLRQHGTYWYHSHTNVQEQKGIYGAFVVQPKKNLIPVNKEIVAVLSDWSDENATDILKNLRKDGDYYLYKKGTQRSFLGAIQAKSLGNYLYNQWTRMGGMDLSDVGYDAFLINGKQSLQLADAKPGDRIRIRLINAAASSYLYVALADQAFNVIAADGVDISPMQTKEILMGMAETYDVLFTVPEKRNFELRVTAQDGTGSASGWIGAGEQIFAPKKPFPDMYATMSHSANHSMGHTGNHIAAEQGVVDHSKMDHSSMSHDPNSDPKNDSQVMDHSKMDHSSMTMDHSQMSHEGHDQASPSQHSKHSQPPILETLSVDDLKAQQPTSFSAKAPVHDVKLILGGDMSRYIWHLNGKAIHQDRTLEIKEGEVVRFTFENTTMMHHPMHLHGHFFRVLNKYGNRSPLKHTVDVPPHGTRTIEFLANEPGEWMLHCHNLYHLKTGMARVVKYMSYTPRKEIAEHQKHDPHLHDHNYFYGRLEAATNHGQAQFKLSKTWDELDLRMETRKDDRWIPEGDLLYRRWFTQFFNFSFGATSYHEQSSGIGGFGYTLPFLIETELMIDTHGKFRFDIEKRLQWTKTIYTNIDFNWRQDQENEYEITLMYSPVWAWSAGLMYTSESFGAGLEYQF